MQKQIEAAKERTKRTPLATYPVKNSAGKTVQVTVPPRETEGLFRIMFCGVQIDQDGNERLDLMRTLTNTREATQNAINERHRIEAHEIRKGKVAPYVRLARIEIQEVN